MCQATPRKFWLVISMSFSGDSINIVLVDLFCWILETWTGFLPQQSDANNQEENNSRPYNAASNDGACRRFVVSHLLLNSTVSWFGSDITLRCCVVLIRCFFWNWKVVLDPWSFFITYSFVPWVVSHRDWGLVATQSSIHVHLNSQEDRVDSALCLIVWDLDFLLLGT